MYSALLELIAISLAILTIGAVGVIGAFLFGSIGTRLRVTKKNEWVFAYSLRAKEYELDESSLPVNYRKAIYFPSLTACMLYELVALAAFKWLVIIPNLQAIYDVYFKLFRSSNNEASLRAMSHTSLVFMFVVALSMGFAMRLGRRLKIYWIQRKTAKLGYTVPVRSRGLTIYPVCFVSTFAVAICEKVAEKYKRAMVAARK